MRTTTVQATNIHDSPIIYYHRNRVESLITWINMDYTDYECYGINLLFSAVTVSGSFAVHKTYSFKKRL